MHDASPQGTRAVAILGKLQIAGSVARFERCANSAEGMLKSGQLPAACLMGLSMVEHSMDVMLFAQGEVFWEEEVSEILRVENFARFFGASNPVVAEALELWCPPAKLTVENATAYVARCLAFALSTAGIRNAGGHGDRYEMVHRWAVEADQLGVVPTRYTQSSMRAILSGDRNGADSHAG